VVSVTFSGRSGRGSTLPSGKPPSVPLGPGGRLVDELAAVVEHWTESTTFWRARASESCGGLPAVSITLRVAAALELLRQLLGLRLSRQQGVLEVRARELLVEEAREGDKAHHQQYGEEPRRHQVLSPELTVGPAHVAHSTSFAALGPGPGPVGRVIMWREPA
jgi:hypothetical protein